PRPHLHSFPTRRSSDLDPDRALERLFTALLLRSELLRLADAFGCDAGRDDTELLRAGVLRCVRLGRALSRDDTVCRRAAGCLLSRGVGGRADWRVEFFRSAPDVRELPDSVRLLRAGADCRAGAFTSERFSAGAVREEEELRVCGVFRGAVASLRRL